MTDSGKPPIANSYWVVPGKFLAGEYPRDKSGKDTFAKLRALESSGVTLFVDLTEEGELLPYAAKLKSAEHRRFGIPDNDIPESPEQTAEILDAIDRHIKHGGLVYLHCWGGVGRTGTIIGCWLVRHGRSGNEALGRLADLWLRCAKSVLRPKSPPDNPWQGRYVRKWNEPG